MHFNHSSSILCRACILQLHYCFQCACCSCLIAAHCCFDPACSINTACSVSSQLSSEMIGMNKPPPFSFSRHYTSPFVKYTVDPYTSGSTSGSTGDFSLRNESNLCDGESPKMYQRVSSDGESSTCSHSTDCWIRTVQPVHRRSLSSCSYSAGFSRSSVCC